MYPIGILSLKFRLSEVQNSNSSKSVHIKLAEEVILPVDAQGRGYQSARTKVGDFMVAWKPL